MLHGDCMWRTSGMNDRPAHHATFAGARLRLPAPAARGMLLAWLAVLLCYGGAQAWGEKYVVTPSGERVELEHVLRPGGVTEDYYEYTDSGGHHVKHGLYKRYYRNGDMREMVTYSHGVENGPFTVWRDGNVKVLEGSYDHGKLDGLVTRYYPSGVKEYEYVYSKGKLDGPFVTYHENGMMRSMGTHKNGQRAGRYFEYHDNGTLYLEGTFVRGFLDGRIRLYNESGEPEAKGELSKERIKGVWVCLAHDGKPAREHPECKGRSYLECPCN